MWKDIIKVRHAGQYVLVALLLASLTSACAVLLESRAGDPGPRRVADARFPHGYSTSPHWKKLTQQPVFRKDVSLARELYGRIEPQMGPGTILVKEEYRLEKGQSHAMSVIGVMRRTDRPEDEINGGWSFEAYDPITKSRHDQDTAACVGCHTLQASNDYLFATPELLQHVEQ